MATYDTIRAELDVLAIVLQKTIAASELDIIAQEWTRTFEGLSDKDFRAAIREHRRHSPYWPTEAHIFAAKDRLTPNRPPLAPLPAHADTPSERRRNEIRAAMVLHSLTHQDPRVRTFFAPGLNWPTRESLAREVLGDRFPQGRSA